MTSSIVRTNPTAGTATTSSVRDNFGAAADEINRLLRATTDKQVTAGTVALSASFSNVPAFALVDGVRILLEIGAANTTANPTLNVNGSGAKDIKKANGESLDAGDLVLGGYYEFVWNESLSRWFCLNLSIISNQDTLLTTILGGLYPVGSLLTTTLATDPGDESYFFNSITFGTWEAYAQGRTIVGIASDATLSSGGITSNVATFVTDAAHNLLVGSQVEIVSVTGVVSPVGTHYVTAIPTTTSFSFALVGGDETFTNFTAASLAKNIAFDTAQEVGGETVHMQAESEVAGHRHNLFANSQGENTNFLSKSEFASGTSSVDNSRFSYAMRANTADADATVGLSSEVRNLSGDSVTQTAMNNLQPYIVTYIWKRTA